MVEAAYKQGRDKCSRADDDYACKVKIRLISVNFYRLMDIFCFTFQLFFITRNRLVLAPILPLRDTLNDLQVISS